MKHTDQHDIQKGEGTKGVKNIVNAQDSKITRKEYKWRDHNYECWLFYDSLRILVDLL